MLIAVADLPGSGKSTLALDLGRALNCAVLGVDQAEAAMWRGREQVRAYAPCCLPCRGALAEEQLALGHHVVVDAVSGLEEARAQWRDLAAKMDAALKFVVVDCSDDRIFRDRLARRIRRIDGYPEPTWEGVLRRRAEFPPRTDDRLAIDSVNSRETNLQAALDYLSAA